MNKEVKKILIVLALYSLSGGIFYNFWELWLAENNMSLNTISVVLSLCSLIAVSVIFLSSNIINPKRLKGFLTILLSIKSIILITLFLLYQSNLNVLIKFLILFDYGIDTEIFACFYPLISLINKDDKLYAVRGLIYDICYYFGVLIVSLLLGIVIGEYIIGYNTYVLFASLLLIIGIIILLTVNTKDYIKKNVKENETGLLITLVKNIKNDKISIYYLLFIFFVNIGYYSIMGLILSVMVREFYFVPQVASSIKLTIGITAVLVATLIMLKLTCKNNYINLSIKFLGRVLLYVVVVIFPNKWTMGFAFLYTMLLASSYTHIADAPYINRFSSSKQLAFANLKEMIGYLSRSIGTFLCGVCLAVSLRYNFLVSAITMLIALLFAYQALYLYNKTKGGKK